MSRTFDNIGNEPMKLPSLPSWAIGDQPEASENVAFLWGAVFAALDPIGRLSQTQGARKLLVKTLALEASVGTSRIEGRLAARAAIRDAFFLTPAGDESGPDGQVLAFWRQAVGVDLRGSDWIATALRASGSGISDMERLAQLMDRSDRQASSQGLMGAVTTLMRNVLAEDARAERLACYLADALIARSLSWPRLLPLSACHLSKASLRGLEKDEPDARLRVQLSVLKGARAALQSARQIAERANALRAAAPKLRSRGANDAVTVFLTENVVAPASMLSPIIKGTRTEMSARNARRFCDRLVELKVATELTGRSTFRLYGIVP